MVYHPSRRISFFLLLYFLNLSLFAGMGPVRVEALSIVRVYGLVVNGNHDPIPDAHIVFWNIERSFSAKTDAFGRYEMNVTPWRSYQAYAYCDYPSTPGFDYVPAYRMVSVGETTVDASFTLLPGASITAEGTVLSFENLYPPTAITFNVIDQYGILNETEAVTRYSGKLLSNYILSLGDRVILVPSNIPLRVEVEIYYQGQLGRHFAIDSQGDYLILDQGDVLAVDLREYTLLADVDLGYGYVMSARAVVEEAEGVGFYVEYERDELSRAEDLVDDAASVQPMGAYDEGFANLREAYLIARSVESGILELYFNALQSVIFITPFLSFTAIVIAAVFIDNLRGRLAIGLALFCILLGLLSVLYPGYTILQKSDFNPWAGTSWKALLTLLLAGASFLGVFLVVHGLPYVFREKTLMEGLRPVSALAAAFATAARNLRRRRLRTLLTAAFMLTSVFAFIALTSLSLERGFFVEPRPGQAPSEGFLLSKPSIIESMPFMPITPTVLQQLKEWLKERPEVTVVVPKIENIPQTVLEPLGVLTSGSGEDFDVFGVLGVYPSLEVQVTQMDRIVEQGQFLSDEDLDGILVSGKAASYLQVGVNDTLMFRGQNFTVTGIFDSGKMEGLKDLDGEPMIPYYLEPGPVPDLMLCFGGDVVVMHGEAARRLPGMVVSRVDVQTQSSEEIIGLARMMVLRWIGFEAYASVADRISRLSIGEYYLASGFASAIFPLVLVILNVGSLMLGAVYERKREVATMSSLGMNPFHITSVFVAEALVIGVVAGSLGYILGLTSYRFMAMFMPLGGKQKVEAMWGILALSLSIAAAVLGSALPATKASVIVTPSLLKRWRIEERPKAAQEPWLLNLPLRTRGEELGGFFSFVEKRLRQYTSHEMGGVENLKVSGKGEATRLSFTYICTAEKVVTDNELFLAKGRLPNRYIIRLASKTRRGTVTALDEANVRRTASFIRRLILQYSTEQRAQEDEAL